MKYGFLIGSLSVATGGPSRVAGVIASSLVERGHSVTIATLEEDEDLVPFDPRVKIRFLAPARKVFPEMGKIIHGIRQLATDTDVVVTSGIWGPVDGLALKLSGITGKPVYIRICGMLEDYILRRNAWKKKLARLLYVDANLRRATGLLVNTRIEGDHVKALGFGKQIKVIPNGVVLPSMEDRITKTAALKLLGIELPEREKALLYLSRIHPKKGMHIFLPAFSRFLKKHPDWSLVVAGDYFSEEYRQQIEEVISGSGLSQKVHFTGEVAGDAKMAAFSLADAFVLPSESEGFSNAVVEAMGWSLPVLITQGCNFPEVEAAMAGKVADFNADSLLKGLHELLDDPAMLPVYAANARRLVEERYQLQDIVDQYESLALPRQV